MNDQKIAGSKVRNFAATQQSGAVSLYQTESAS
jgi:hypothetical protein